jgi:hypothetical protein
MVMRPRSGLKLVPLTERTGALRHEDDKQAALIKAAVNSVLDERESRVVQKLERVVDRFENGMGRLMDVVEAFRSGDRDTAVVSLTEGVDDLPSVARIKAVPSAVYTHTAAEIAKELAIKTQDVAFLLNRQGLNWVLRKDDLWDTDTYKRTHRRLWHPKTVALLRDVLRSADHDERFSISRGCERVLARCGVPSIGAS